MYDHGLGVPRDLQTAASWYRKAAKAGDAMAQNDLADLYLRGEGVPQSDSEAFRLFRLAADQGQTAARIKLAYLYSTGRGTTKDLAAAYILLTAAANAGDARGKDLQRSIESQLTSAQIAEARQKARQLTTTSPEQLSAKALLQ